MQENPNNCARLLTHDTGPIVTARSLGLPYSRIKDEWRLPPENSESERENARLRERVTQLEKTEPRFRIDFVDCQRESMECLEIDFLVYEPLSPEDLRALIEQLTNHFPIENDFGPTKPIEEDVSGTVVRRSTVRRRLIPASDEEIDKYKNQDYPGWVRDCEKTLSNVHKDLQSREGLPYFVVAITNEGARPGLGSLSYLLQLKAIFKYVLRLTITGIRRMSNLLN